MCNILKYFKIYGTVSFIFTIYVSSYKVWYRSYFINDNIQIYNVNTKMYVLVFFGYILYMDMFYDDVLMYKSIKVYSVPFC